MEQWILQHEQVIRLGCFLGIFGIMAVWEWLTPRRQLSRPKTARWFNNLALTLLNTLVLRIIFSLLLSGMALGAAMLAETLHWGLFNIVSIPYGLAFVSSLLLLDMAIYWQHVAFHHVPWLWRLHRVHHCDMDIDVTTGARFHPVEIVLSMLFKVVLVFILGPPVAAVLVFEVLLNVCAMFNHANVLLPTSVDRWLRMLLVTPDMHRVHHSVIKKETNSNYGFSLSWWDRLFGSYCAQPQGGHDDMTIGLESFRANKDQQLPSLLLNPFSRNG